MDNDDDDDDGNIKIYRAPFLNGSIGKQIIYYEKLLKCQKQIKMLKVFNNNIQ